METLKEIFAEKALPMAGEIKAMLKEHGSHVMGEYTLAQMYGGMKGIVGMVTETSKLDSEEKMVKIAKDIEKDLGITISENDVWDFLFSDKLEKSGIVIVQGKMHAVFKTLFVNDNTDISKALGEVLDLKMLEDGFRTLNTQHILSRTVLELGKPGISKSIGKDQEERFKALGNMSALLVDKLGKKWNSFFWLLEYTINREMDEKKS